MLKIMTIVCCMLLLCSGTVLSGDLSEWEVEISGYGQMQGLTKDPFFNNNNKGFTLPNFRPKFELTNQQGVTIVGEFKISSTTTLKNGFLEYQILDTFLVAKAGQFINRAMFFEPSPRKKHFLLYSQANHYIEAQYPTGFALRGVYGSTEWEVQAFNGTATGQPDNNEAKDISLYLKYSFPYSTLATCVQHGAQPDGRRTIWWVTLSRDNPDSWLKQSIGVIAQWYTQNTMGIYLTNRFAICQGLELTARGSLTSDKSLMMANGYYSHGDPDFTGGLNYRWKHATVMVNAIFSRFKPVYGFLLQYEI